MTKHTFAEMVFEQRLNFRSNNWLRVHGFPTRREVHKKVEGPHVTIKGQNRRRRKRRDRVWTITEVAPGVTWTTVAYERYKKRNNLQSKVVYRRMKYT